MHFIYKSLIKIGLYSQISPTAPPIQISGYATACFISDVSVEPKDMPNSGA